MPLRDLEEAMNSCFMLTYLPVIHNFINLYHVLFSPIPKATYLFIPGIEAHPCSPLLNLFLILLNLF